jgi:membrane protease YdiL (CAAX protease family)
VNPFRNQREGRLRTLWRLLLQYTLSWYLASVLFLALTFTSLAIASGAGFEGYSAEMLVASPTFRLASSAVTSLAAAVASVWLAGRFLDHRPFSDFGLRLNRGWGLDFCFGLALGALLMTSIFLVELASGWITVTGTFEVSGGTSPFALAILIPLAAFVCVGFSEELLSRGYQLKNLAEGLNFPFVGPRRAVLLAWVLSSGVFGLLHLANPNASLLSTVNITFAGLLLGTGYVLTGRLAIPIGLHITWNFFQGNVFGFPVSGIEPVSATFLTIEQGGPALFTGGVFGPEAGLLDPVATLVGSLLIWLWVRARSGNATLQPPIAEPPDGRSGEAVASPKD